MGTGMDKIEFTKTYYIFISQTKTQSFEKNIINIFEFIKLNQIFVKLINDFLFSNINNKIDIKYPIVSDIVVK